MSDLISRFFEEGMMWESPIKVIQKQVKKQMEDEILKAVQEVGIVVDKAELMKALKYDREQYERGYVDGFNANKWIPVEERLPEKIGYYLVCYRGGLMEMRVFKHGWEYPEYIDPVAWMPLPEAYKGE